MIELYHWRPVSHSARVLICLHEIGVKFESRYVDLLDFEHFSDEFLSLNPLGQVPVLKADDITITESSLINEYLAESYPEAGLAATDAPGWYKTQIWSKFVDYNLSSSLGTLGCQKHLVPLLRDRDQAELRNRIDDIPVEERRTGWLQAASDDISEDTVVNSRRKTQLVVERMEEMLSSTEWLLGNSYSIADINTFAMIVSLAEIVPDVINAETAERTLDWLDRVAGRPAVKAALTDSAGSDTIFAPGPEHSRWG